MTTIRLATLVLLVIAGAELGSRLDDQLFDGIAVTANATYADLITRDAVGRHGTPHGNYKKWHLNNFGFRGPDIELRRRPNCRRILILGASETFGLHESPGQEYPALLRKDNSSCVEIVNTAVAGMGLQTMRNYWETRLKPFEPDQVLIYPSPLFYLANELTQENHAITISTTGDHPRPFRSRFVDRLRDIVHTPQFIQLRRDKHAVEAGLAGKPAVYVFESIPTERLDAFQHDLDALVAAIGAARTPVALITHAIRLGEHEDGIDDAFDVWEARVHTPRATGRIIVAFNSAANERVRAVAQTNGVQVIDVSSSVTGCHECFGDLIHFTDLGAKRVADTIKGALRDGVRREDALQ